MLKGKRLLRGAGLAMALTFAFTFLIGPYVANAAPVAVEVVRYTGNTQVDAPNFAADLKAALTKLGVDASQVKFTDANKNDVNATDSFNWTKYDHPGVKQNEAEYPGEDKSFSGVQHIVVKNNGKNITFYGYGQSSFKDFMFMTNNDPGTKTFTFTLDEANIKYHSMEGGGFLFNSQIANGNLNGYAIIFDQYGMELFQLENVNVDAFHNATGKQMRQVAGITLLKTYDKGQSKTHAIKINVTPSKLDLWDNGNQTIDGYSLPKVYSYGFGPIATYNEHDCSELSYFTFDNLRMTIISNISLADLINGAKWSSCSNRYIMNLEDGIVPEFNDAAKLSSILNKMAKDGAYYIGCGTEANQQQAQDFIKQNGNRGVFISNADYATVVNTMAANITDRLKADVAAAKAALTPGLVSGDNLQGVTKNMKLALQGSNCTNITWSSSNPSVISTAGVVKQSEDGNVTVTLTATITKGGIKETKQFTVIVKKKEVLVKTGSPINTATLSLLGLSLILAGAITIGKRPSRKGV